MPGRRRARWARRRPMARRLDSPAAFASPTMEETARAVRLAELKAQIDAGTYRPNLKCVAERMLPDLLNDIG